MARLSKIEKHLRGLSNPQLNDPKLSAAWSHRGQMQRLVYDLLLRHAAAGGQIPTNGRFVFYELEQQGFVSKSKPEDRNRRGGAGNPREQDVTDALTYLREQLIVPWEWLEDETRTLHEWEYAPTVADYVRDAAEYARINPWPDEPPLILAESRSLAGPLRPTAGEYLASLAATNGQTAGFLHTKVAPALADNNRPVLYLGDLDPQGGDIEANTRRVLEQETGRDISWTRVAITAEQVGPPRNLTSRWKEDQRFGKDSPGRWYEAWETEALGQGEVVRLVREALDNLLLPERLTDVRAREQAQREQVAETLDNLDLEE